MRFLDSVLLLVTVVACITVPYFSGHAWAAHQGRWALYAAGGLVVALIAGAILVHRLRNANRGHASA